MCFLRNFIGGWLSFGILEFVLTQARSISLRLQIASEGASVREIAFIDLWDDVVLCSSAQSFLRVPGSN
jgi:hypothetical protein